MLSSNNFILFIYLFIYFFSFLFFLKKILKNKKKKKLTVIRSHFTVVVERELLGKCKKISAWSALLSRIKATFGKMSVHAT